MARALVVGDVMTDILAQLGEPLQRGSDAAARIVERPGGAAASFAVRLAREGVEVDLVARVAAGDVERLKAEFAAQGVTAWLAGDAAKPTGRLIAVVEPSGERSFLTDRGANDGLTLDDVPSETLVHADWLHISGYALQNPTPRAAMRDLLRRASEIPVSVDPGSLAPLRAIGAQNFLDLTAGAAVLLPNADEAAALTGSDDPAAQREKLAGKYGLVVIKRGADGAEAFSSTARWSADAPPTRAVDTTGAGDAFAAAFVAGRLARLDADACLARAVAAGAAATTHLGARPA